MVEIPNLLKAARTLVDLMKNDVDRAEVSSAWNDLRLAVQLEELKALPDDQIDTSDIPGTTEEFWAGATRGRFKMVGGEMEPALITGKDVHAKVEEIVFAPVGGEMKQWEGGRFTGTTTFVEALRKHALEGKVRHFRIETDDGVITGLGHREGDSFVIDRVHPDE